MEFKLHKLIERVELQTGKKLLLEDSLVSAVASLKYSDKMLQKAIENKLDSQQYWTDRKAHAEQRIGILKGKGEEETDEVHQKADTLLSDLENKSKKTLSEYFKDPKFKETAKVFIKELKNHLTFKAVMVHTAHHINTLIKPVYNTAVGLIKTPKQTIEDLKVTSKEYFSSTYKAMKNSRVLVSNATNVITSLNKKYKTKFNDEEKKDLMSDPDKLHDKLLHKLNDEEIKDMKRVVRHAVNLATASLCVHYVSHVANGAINVSASAINGISAVSIEAVKEVSGEHLKIATKEAFINASIFTLDLVEHTNTHEGEHEKENTDYKIFGVMVPFLKLFSKGKNQKTILKKTAEQLTEPTSKGPEVETQQEKTKEVN